MTAARVLVLAPHGQDAAVIADVLAGAGAEPLVCGDLARLAAALDARASAVVATEEDLAGPALDALLTWVTGQPSWSDLPFLILGARTTRSAVQSALLESLGNAVLLERPLATEALATAVRAALRARARQVQMRAEVAAREEAAALLRETNLSLEQRVAERTAELAASEARFRAYFESFPEALFVVRVVEGAAGEVGFAYEGLNPAAERAAGARSAEVVGKPPAAFLPPLNADAAHQEFRRCVVLGRTHRYSQVFGYGAEARAFDVVLTPMRDAEGRIARLLGAALDVTQQRQAEERLRQSQKLEALGQLTGGVAHDFNNLLQVIVSGLALMERVEDSRRRAALIESMRRAAGRGADLVRRLLSFARREALNPETIALGPWIEAHVRELLSQALHGGVVVRTRLAAGLPPVRADATELELALLNLALNARDAMPGGGELLIEAEPAGAESRDAAGLDGAFVRLSVTDTGTGMTAEALARVFEPFFTTKPPGQGTGLGLAQVYGFARQSGGTARVSSAPGKGTAVSILLPVASPRTSDGAPESAAGEATTLPAATLPDDGRPLSVLVCEDEDAVGALACQLLVQLGHRARRVASAAEALAVLDEDDAPAGPGVDLLLTDVIMPGGMDGAALAREAARRHPGLRVLLTTGYEGRADARGLPVLRKPYRLDDLASVLTEAVHGVAAPKASRSPA